MLLNLNRRIWPQKQHSKFVAVISACLLTVVLAGHASARDRRQTARKTPEAEIGYVRNLGKVMFTDFRQPLKSHIDPVGWPRWLAQEWLGPNWRNAPQHPSAAKGKLPVEWLFVIEPGAVRIGVSWGFVPAGNAIIIGVQCASEFTLNAVNVLLVAFSTPLWNRCRHGQVCIFIMAAVVASVACGAGDFGDKCTITRQTAKTADIDILNRFAGCIKFSAPHYLALPVFRCW